MGPNIQAPVLGISIYKLIGVTLIFIVIAATFSYSKDIFKLAYSQILQINVGLYLPEWMIKKFDGDSVHKKEDEARVGPAPVDDATTINTKNDESNKAEASFEQTWCLVGEDEQGRWCIQVKSKESCDTERTYDTKNSCEKPNK